MNDSIARLEEQIAHLTRTVDDLSDIVRAQADQIVVTSRFRFTRDDGLETSLSSR